MRIRLITGTLLLAACVAAPVAAQEEGRSVGLGLGLHAVALDGDDAAIFGILAPQLYVPIVVSEKVMLEPSLSLFRGDTEGDDFSSSLTFFRLGIGVLFLSDAGADGRVYVGPRLGVLRVSEEFDNTTFEGTSKRMDLVFAAVAGGEFFLASSLSLGGEIGLEYTRIGDEEETPEPGFVDDRTTTLVRTVTELRLRWYLR